PIVVDKVWRNLHDVLDVEVDCHVFDEEQSDAWKDGVFKCIRRTGMQADMGMHHSQMELSRTIDFLSQINTLSCLSFS
ncbi:10423_t:CDS:2, partial [Paraglomus brasilianum]